MLESFSGRSNAEGDCALVLSDVRLSDTANGQHAAAGCLRQLVLAASADLVSVFIPRHRVAGSVDTVLVRDPARQLDLTVHPFSHRLLPRHCTHTHTHTMDQ